MPLPSMCCFGKWQTPSSVAAVALPFANLCSHLRVLDADVKELARFAVADEREQGHEREICGQELMS